MKALILLLLLATGTILPCFPQQANYDVLAANGNGLRFWSDNAYKIHMGTGTEYWYGPVADFSIKMNMNNQANRGWTWGVTGQTPVAALNTQGNMQIAGTFNAMGQISVGGVGVITNGGQDIYANIRVLRNTSSSYTDGLYLGYMGSGGPLRFFSNSGSTEFMTLATTGNLGIGTTSPNQKLEVNGNVLQNAENSAFGIDAQANARLGFLKKSGREPIIASDVNSGIVFGQTNQNGIFTNIPGSIITERMRIHTNGNVGIGTPTPQSKLEVSGNNAGFQGSDISISRATTSSEVGMGATLQFNDVGSGSYNIIQGSSSGLQFFSSYNNGGWLERMRITPNGQIGIGTPSPWNDLHIKKNSAVESAVILENTSSNKVLQISNYGNTGDGVYWAGLNTANTTSINCKGGAFIMRADNGLIFSGSNTTEHMRISSTGKIGINTNSPDPNYELSVNGKIKTKEIKVTQLGWSDYVFYKDYKLKPLSEVESFIKENQHLSEIPSAADVEKDGINLGEMNAILLKKIEEITLYLIEQKKEIEYLKDLTSSLKHENESLRGEK